MSATVFLLTSLCATVLDDENHRNANELKLAKPTMRQMQEIKSLIDQLELKSVAAEKSCYAAADRLKTFERLAFPQLIEHFDDKRQSADFFHLAVAEEPEHLVGDACIAIIREQLIDTPSDYSEIGLGRTGRNGEWHTKPIFSSSPFESSGGLEDWLAENKNLTYLEMRIKCLQWFLDEERKIGASDPESYFLNILPLEIRILELRFDKGENVSKKLQELRNRHQKRKPEDVPKHLLPPK